jgi:hypothetical protein
VEQLEQKIKKLIEDYGALLDTCRVLSLRINETE